MSDQAEQHRAPILYGSIIHLQNGYAGGDGKWIGDGGYLETRGHVDEDVVDYYIDPRVKGLVSTHLKPNRLMGSGSWEILSAVEKPIGTKVQIGDAIYLRNIFSENEYLDSFEWVPNLKPFANYPMTFGVFTSNKPRRGGGFTGTWRIQSNDQQQGVLHSGDAVFLRNEYGAFSFLCTHGKVSQNDIFKNRKFDGQRMFVFTGSLPMPNEAHYTWTITLSNRAENIYYLWGSEKGEWVDYGLIKNNGLSKQAIIALKMSHLITDSSLVGKVTYRDEGVINVSATRDANAHYQVTHSMNPKFIGHEQEMERFPNGRWIFGSRNDKIKEIDILSNDDGVTFRGTITYEIEKDEEVVQVKGTRAATKLYNTDQHTLLYDFFAPTLWESRVDKVSHTLAKTQSKLKMLLSQWVDEKDLEAEGGNYPYLDNHFDLNYTGKDEANPDYDLEYQLTQLLNTHTFWLKMDSFWRKFNTISTEATNALTQANKLPQVHQIRESIKQLTIDFEILQQTVEQRQMLTAADTENREQTDLLSQSLLITDKLTLMSLAPMQHLIKGAPYLIPITYFSKNIHIRELPYTDQIVLVGMTYDLAASAVGLPSEAAVNSPTFELMAIPHEVGHFMYQHARLNEFDTIQTIFDNKLPVAETITFEKLSEQFRNNPYYHWCEEIFADLYGCLIAGPLAVLGMQAHLATGDPRRVLEDDEEHPTPILRPYVLSEMLRILNAQSPDQYNFVDTAMSLDANWTAILERWGFVVEDLVLGRPARIVLPDVPGSHFEDFINVRRVLQNARPMIEKFAQVLFVKGHVELEPWKVKDDGTALSANIPWSAKHDSLEEYIQVINDLPQQKLIGKKLPIQTLVSAFQLETSIEDDIRSLLMGQNEELLDEWHDSGPSGSGIGAH